MKRHNQIIFTTALSLLFTLTTVDTSSLPGTVAAFRVINRRRLVGCPDPNPYLEIHVSSDQRLPDQGFVEVNVTGVVFPSEHDWMAMISPSDSDVKTCVENKLKYEETGDSSHLPLLCHYPVKAQNLTSDPYYLNCTNKECKKQLAGKCLVRTCSATLRFHVVNIRTDIEFVLFGGGFDTPCILKRSDPLSFANPNSPLYGHLSSPDSTGTKVRIYARLC
ncbi:nucleotide pyrophosphatase/phosphodiesterase [Striga asiatica]|uniref:Nucleotide pyrophosphatase/phosphodiesterase n=1 Tax=Striga asiatica TaxID=4170 RepID=A0A5A7PFM2_STRAF|nr:nucleotide pyrophosphatase/phosphodiesterase [Striga asiatica]